MIDHGLVNPDVLDEESCVLLGLLVRDVHLRDLAWALIARPALMIMFGYGVLSWLMCRQLWRRHRCVCWGLRHGCKEPAHY